jgi:predicted RNA-binding protein
MEDVMFVLSEQLKIIMEDVRRYQINVENGIIQDVVQVVMEDISYQVEIV